MTSSSPERRLDVLLAHHLPAMRAVRRITPVRVNIPNDVRKRRADVSFEGRPAVDSHADQEIVRRNIDDWVEGGRCKYAEEAEATTLLSYMARPGNPVQDVTLNTAPASMLGGGRACSTQGVRCV